MIKYDDIKYFDSTFIFQHKTKFYKIKAIANLKYIKHFDVEVLLHVIRTITNIITAGITNSCL